MVVRWWGGVVFTALCCHTNFVFGLKLGCEKRVGGVVEMAAEDPKHGDEERITSIIGARTWE